MAADAILRALYSGGRAMAVGGLAWKHGMVRVSSRTLASARFSARPQRIGLRAWTQRVRSRRAGLLRACGVSVADGRTRSAAGSCLPGQGVRALRQPAARAWLMSWILLAALTAPACDQSNSAELESDAL